MLPIKDYPGPRRRMPWMTWAIILLNIAIFSLPGPHSVQDASAFMFAYSVVPYALTHGVSQTALLKTTYPISHTRASPISR